MAQENKKPMSKAKKEFIAAIIVVVCAVIILVAGVITTTIQRNNIWIGGIIMTCGGAAMLGLGIYDLVKRTKIYKQEKEAH